MMIKITKYDIPPPDRLPKENDLYGVVRTFGKTFELRYGYYTERDRENPLCGPDVIYPDFLKSPLYTDDGEPFVTMMQDACENFKGTEKRTDDSSCADCRYCRQGEEWFGICVCAKNRKKE